jgi:hypothetical protein
MIFSSWWPRPEVMSRAVSEARLNQSAAKILVNQTVKKNDTHERLSFPFGL